MNIQPLHPNFLLPVRGSERAGAYDLHMLEDGKISQIWTRKNATKPVKVKLGFAAEVPAGHVALLLPRSGAGAKYSVELENTCGVIDEDYRGEWVANLNTKNGEEFCWKSGERVLQMLIVPVHTPVLKLVSDLTATARGTGGFGSTDKKAS